MKNTAKSSLKINKLMKELSNRIPKGVITSEYSSEAAYYENLKKQKKKKK